MRERETKQPNLSCDNKYPTSQKRNFPVIKSPNYIHNTNRISGSTPETRTRIGENRDQNMLLHIKRPRIKRKFPRSHLKRRRWQHSRHEPADRKSGDLDRNHRND